MAHKKFVNTAKRIDPSKDRPYTRNCYGFDRVPILMFQWSRLFQALVSQAGTYLLTGKFHDQHCGIYKCEGGCKIVGVGDLVPNSHGCYFDTYYKAGSEIEKKAQKISDMITEIVLAWNPNDPIESMLKATADYIKVDAEELRKVVFGSDVGGVFGGDALSSFFDWNPFSEPPYDEDYRRFCLVDVLKHDAKEVEQLFADEKLGKELKEKVNALIRSAAGGSYVSTALCCSPRRDKDNKLAFWINTGRCTQIDGWKTQADIEEFLKSDGKLVDKARY